MSPTTPTSPPKVILFDIGGVCVLSPFRAILDYELARDIPPGWINFSISRSAPDGAWQRLERGEIENNPEFFRLFNEDLHREDLWREHCVKAAGKSVKAIAGRALKVGPGARTDVRDPVEAAAEADPTAVAKSVRAVTGGTQRPGPKSFSYNTVDSTASSDPKAVAESVRAVTGGTQKVGSNSTSPSTVRSIETIDPKAIAKSVRAVTGGTQKVASTPTSHNTVIPPGASSPRGVAASIQTLLGATQTLAPHPPPSAAAAAASTDPSSAPTHQPLPNIDGESLFWSMMAASRTPDPYMYPALRALKSSNRFLVGALSNTNIFPADHPFAKDTTHLDLKTLFDVFVSSAHVGLRKPERGIYELAERKVREEWVRQGRGRAEELRAGDLLFLDDIGENLRTARVAGWRTLKVGLGGTREAVRTLEEITGVSLLEGKSEAKL